MDKIPSPEKFFPEMERFAHAEIFGGVERPWDVLCKIRPYIAAYFLGKESSALLPNGIKIIEGADGEDSVFCESPVKLEEELCIAEMNLKIGKGTKIEPTALIKGNCIIGENCDVRHGAYLRGDIIAGDVCTLGHTTEIKGSIIMNHSEMGHFNYIGDSVIGSYVNIGAGTKLANLKFRKPDAKRKVEFPEITFNALGSEVKSGISKFGAIIGDHCETGCNSVLSPAVLLGPECWVYPNLTVPSGYYPPQSFLAPEKLKVKPRRLP